MCLCLHLNLCLYDDDDDDENDSNENDGDDDSKEDNDNEKDGNTKYVKIIHEDSNIIVIDKPSTIPVHPCGGYNFNSLCHILSDQHPTLKHHNLYNIHRLDRLTSGLTILTKNSHMAQVLGKCINDRDGCFKVYLARVKGCFPCQADLKNRLDVGSMEETQEKGEGKGEGEGEEGVCKDNVSSSSSLLLPLPCISNGEWTMDHIDNNGTSYKKGDTATTFWITNQKGENVTMTTSFNDVFQSRIDPTKLTHDGLALSSSSSSSSKSLPKPTEGEGEDGDEKGDEMKEKDMLWFNLACPCEIVCHKNGVCKAGNVNGKAAQTAFSVVHYDKETDSTIVLAKPLTG